MVPSERKHPNAPFSNDAYGSRCRTDVGAGRHVGDDVVVGGVGASARCHVHRLGRVDWLVFVSDRHAGEYYIDKDGTFYFQQSAALYGASEPLHWEFFSGTNLETASKSSAISNAVNPNNANDKNNDTTWRCNNSPTGLESTNAPSRSTYSQRNFCDLAGVWVDPDTGDWHGLVHNEFIPQPFGDGLHFDAIDHAVSTNQGRTWTGQRGRRIAHRVNGPRTAMLAALGVAALPPIQRY